MSKPRNDRRSQRREEALERAEARAERTDAEQLVVLEERGITSGKEVDRLKKRIG